MLEYTGLGEVRSEFISKELEISGIQDVRLEYKQNWIKNLERTDNTGLVLRDTQSWMK